MADDKKASRVAVNRSAPSATVVPILVYADVAKAIEWLSGAFGFVERLRVERDGVVGHAQLIVGDGAIMIGRQGAEYHPPRPGEVQQYVVVHVPDADEHFQRAQQHGARIVQAPHDTPFGERQYTVEDPECHRWTFSAHAADIPPESWGAKLAVK
jgi:uncharacterized glyoxalase superfamily protein PhnB